jgi:hypothetical protein
LGRWQWPGSCRGVLSCDAAAGIPKPGRISRCRIDLGGRPHRAASGVALELNQAANLAVQVWERLGDYGVSNRRDRGGFLKRCRKPPTSNPNRLASALEPYHQRPRH